LPSVFISFSFTNSFCTIHSYSKDISPEAGGYTMNEGDVLMDNDDKPVGYVLTRREVLALFGSAAFLAACSPQTGTVQPTATAVSSTATSAPANTATAAPTNTVAPSATTAATEAANVTTAATATEVAAATSVPLPTCVVRPELTEGPYFVDEKLDRSDIRANSTNGVTVEGAPLQLTFRVTQISDTACMPLAGVAVDIWHCDAEGVYSDAVDRSFDTTGQDFLRGYQLTDATGNATFTTIYPGWYDGRAVHIHFKIRSDINNNSGYEFTSQLFFDDAFTDEVYVAEPYVSKGIRTLLNAQDGIFNDGGSELLLTVTGDAQSGYMATFDIGLQMG
jgi:protocatechuate 3,4-dioxygenase beta subunit